MIDIVSVTGGDLRFLDTDVPRAANILATQLASLEYAPDLGIDLRYFLNEKFSFQNASFKAYLVQRLAENGINVGSVGEVISNLFSTLTFNVDDSQEAGSGMIAR